jgi:hypothetical protein
VSFILTLNCGLEEMHSVGTGGDRRITAEPAIVILDNMMMGGKYQGVMIILCAEVFIGMLHGLLKMN